MKPSEILRLAIVLAIAVAGTFLFLPKGEALGVSAIMGAMIATVLIGQMAAPKAFILRNPRAFTVGGWSLGGLGLIVGLVLGWKGDEGAMFPGILLSVVGIALATLPRSLRVTEAMKARESAISPSEPSAARAGWEALILPFRDLRASAQVLGPWLALFVVLPTATFTPFLLFGDKWIKGMSRGEASFMLLGALLLVLAMYGVLMVASIQWSRFVAWGKAPPLGVPLRPLWSFAWRWILFGGLSRVPDRLGPWLIAHAPSLPHWANVSLTNLAGWGFLTLISPMGLVLPAVALGEKDTSIVGAMASRRAYGQRFYLGAFVVLSPFAVTSWLLELLPDNRSNTVVGNGLGVALVVLLIGSLFLTMTGAMAYLTRVRAGAGLTA